MGVVVLAHLRDRPEGQAARGGRLRGLDLGDGEGSRDRTCGGDRGGDGGVALRAGRVRRRLTDSDGGDRVAPAVACPIGAVPTATTEAAAAPAPAQVVTRAVAAPAVPRAS